MNSCKYGHVTYSAAIYALNFAGTLDWALYKKIAGVALEVGRSLDQRRPPYVDMGDGRVVICSSRFNVPHIELDLQDRLVVHKPPG